MRITDASQLRRGMVLTLRYPQTDPAAPAESRQYATKGVVVTAVLSNHFRGVYVTKVLGCTKHQDVPYFFTAFQIPSEEVTALHPNACSWVEYTGDKTEEEVQRMLEDDCLVCA